MKASISPTEIPISSHSIRSDVGREFLTISCPDGWDDVKKLTKKVLTYDGRKFTFAGWNSDRNECFFARDINQDPPIAKIS